MIEIIHLNNVNQYLSEGLEISSSSDYRVQHVEIFLHQMEKAKAIYSELATSPGSQLLSLAFWQTKRQAGERESFMVEKGFRCALIQGYLYGEDVGGLTRVGHPM